MTQQAGLRHPTHFGGFPFPLPQLPGLTEGTDETRASI